MVGCARTLRTLYSCGRTLDSCAAKGQHTQRLRVSEHGVYLRDQIRAAGIQPDVFTSSNTNVHHFCSTCIYPIHNSIGHPSILEG